jgi:hypothetical protein
LVPSKEAAPLSIAPQLEILLIEREDEKEKDGGKGETEDMHTSRINMQRQIEWRQH